jgi:hypothetical protein
MLRGSTTLETAVAYRTGRKPHSLNVGEEEFSKLHRAFQQEFIRNSSARAVLMVERLRGRIRALCEEGKPAARRGRRAWGLLPS